MCLEKWMSKVIGYFVLEFCEDYEQVLGVKTGPAMPPGGVLDWTDGPRALFASRDEARKAISRTEHYRLAFGANLPEKAQCKVAPVSAAGT
jgi:hypothetical protein